MDATKAIASMPPGNCLGALEMLQQVCSIPSEGALYEGEHALVPRPGLKLHQDNEGDCLRSPDHYSGALAIAPVEITIFPHRVPFTREKMPWCPCPFKNEAYRPTQPSCSTT